MDKQTNGRPSSRWLDMSTIRQGYYVHGEQLIQRLFWIKGIMVLIYIMFHSTQVTNCLTWTLPCTTTCLNLADIPRMSSHLLNIYQMTLQQKYVQIGINSLLSMALQDFIPHLKDHICTCTSAELWVQQWWSQVLGYWMKHSLDSMVMSPESGEDVHLFWYAQVLGVFHTQVLHVDPAATNKSVQNIEFLWVWWLGLVPGCQFGFKEARLPKVGFVPHTDPLAFGFLDPSLVLRGCHLVPAFADGKTLDLLPVMHSAARSPDEHKDWVAFYVMLYIF